MEPSRPLAKRRLLQAIETALGEADILRNLEIAELQKKISVLSQEKRFLTFTCLLHQKKPLTSQEIATKIKDQHSNVQRNLHVLVAEKIFLVERDPITGIHRFSINRRLTNFMSEFFRGDQTKNLSQKE
ncbi:hypothetical protein [Methylobacterium nonmethylotrophicum]|uniref:HTH arsR-type domain-containing protein n=1 Tax=Methylobacterium nonmethylotrophicum TaxID=1141884 RepID=A0A4Z0NFM7_9HYPH|nr:hypothetical protein [Methylobacterium nonmethylotrophicum]TGD94566.1 hypothetical protein EU555_31915 [Methylobacterium nonmethylotrophicum]